MDLQDKSEYQEQGPKKGIVIIVITILLGTNGLLLWQFFDKKNSLDKANETIVTTTAEKDALQVQLNRFKAEYEKIKAENADLQNQLAEKDEEIKAKVLEIQKLIKLGGPAQIARAKAELARLKELNDVYLANIDSLNVMNRQLQQENQKLSTNLSQEMTKTENLSAENSRLYNKVTAGSILQAENISTQGLRYKSNGKEIFTSKAKQVQKIRTQFILGENNVIDNGPVDIYIRVLGPDGVVMSASRETFISSNKELQYTLKEVVNYNNNETPVEVSWAKGSDFVPGKYNVEIYHLGVLIGNSIIELK